MCGILAVLKKKNEINKELFSVMLDTLSKRGPDNKGVYFEKNLALGQRRLSIIDLSEAGSQPMWNEDNTVAALCNGEIYNYLNVNSELKQKHVFKGRCDTETLVHAYEEFGQKMVEHIEGMFAYVIYDKKNRELTVARDHFGKKPVYYFLDDEYFAIASEIKALIADPEIKKRVKINQSSLVKYLFYGYIPSPESIFDKIKKLEPSSTFKFDIENWKIVSHYKYWSLEKLPLKKDITKKDVLPKTEDLIRKAVKKRLMSDVPLGVFLSGGVDSSLVTALLSQVSADVNAFTVCYKNSPEADESVYAERVAKKLGINYHLCYFEDALVKENFIEILNYLDEPIADAAIIPLYYVAKFARDKITVALSGDGGDEVFGGYGKYKAQKAIEDYKFFLLLASLAKPLLPKASSYYKLLDCVRLPFAARQFIYGSGSFLVEEASKLLKSAAIDINEIFREAIQYTDDFKQNDVINKALYLDCKIQLPDWYLVKGDRATMAVSLEMRNPLLDKELAEYEFTLPGSWKIRSGQTKYLLKKIAEKYVDRDILYRQKSGFGVPLDKWIRNELKDMFDRYLYSDSGYFNLDYVKKIHKEHLEGRADHRFKLLRIFNFNYWKERYYE